MADQINTETNGGGGGSNVGIVLIVAIVILVALGAYFILNSGPLVTERDEVNVDVETPASPDINMPDIELPDVELPEAPEAPAPAPVE
jgi:hypothetical protein